MLNLPLIDNLRYSLIETKSKTSTDSSIQIHLPDPNEEKIRNLSKKLGLKCVGWIFTDLVMEDPRLGTVKHFRGNSDTYFLSSDECITAGYFQNMYKNFTRYSSEGFFGSKFVTVVVTGRWFSNSFDWRKSTQSKNLY